MKIYTPEEFKNTKVEYTSDLDASKLDVDSLADVGATLLEIDDKKVENIESNFETIMDTRDELLGLDVGTDANAKAIKEKRREYGLDDDMYNMTTQQMENPTVARNIGSKLQKFLNKSDVKEMVYEGKVMQNFRDSIDTLRRKNPRMAAVAQYDYNQIKAGATDEEGRPLDPTSYGIGDYQEVNVAQLMETEFKSMKEMFPDLEMGVREGEGGYYIYSEKEGINMDKDEFTDYVVDKYADDPRMRNTLRSVRSQDVPLGQQRIDDQGAIEDYVSKKADKAFSHLNKAFGITSNTVKMDRTGGGSGGSSDRYGGDSLYNPDDWSDYGAFAARRLAREGYIIDEELISRIDNYYNDDEDITTEVDDETGDIIYYIPDPMNPEKRKEVGRFVKDKTDEGANVSEDNPYAEGLVGFEEGEEDPVQPDTQAGKQGIQSVPQSSVAPYKNAQAKAEDQAKIKEDQAKAKYQNTSTKSTPTEVEDKPDDPYKSEEVRQLEEELGPETMQELDRYENTDADKGLKEVDSEIDKIETSLEDGTYQFESDKKEPRKKLEELKERKEKLLKTKKLVEKNRATYLRNKKKAKEQFVKERSKVAQDLNKLENGGTIRVNRPSATNTNVPLVIEKSQDGKNYKVSYAEEIGNVKDQKKYGVSFENAEIPKVYTKQEMVEMLNTQTTLIPSKESADKGVTVSDANTPMKTNLTLESYNEVANKQYDKAGGDSISTMSVPERTFPKENLEVESKERKGEVEKLGDSSNNKVVSMFGKTLTAPGTVKPSKEVRNKANPSVEKLPTPVLNTVKRTNEKLENTNRKVAVEPLKKTENNIYVDPSIDSKKTMLEEAPRTELNNVIENGKTVEDKLIEDVAQDKIARSMDEKGMKIEEDNYIPYSSREAYENAKAAWSYDAGRLGIPKEDVPAAPKPENGEAVKTYADDFSNKVVDFVKKFDDYTYSMSEDGKTIDCSSLMFEVLNNAGLGDGVDATSQGIWLKSENRQEHDDVDNFNPNDFKSGTIISFDTGDHGFDKGRKYGIDHVGMIIKDENGNPYLLESSSGHNGVTMLPFDKNSDRFKVMKDISKKMFTGEYTKENSTNNNSEDEIEYSVDLPEVTIGSSKGLDERDVVETKQESTSVNSPILEEELELPEETTDSKSLDERDVVETKQENTSVNSPILEEELELPEGFNISEDINTNNRTDLNNANIGVDSISVRMNNPLNISDKGWGNPIGSENPIDGDAAITKFGSAEEGLSAFMAKVQYHLDGKGWGKSDMKMKDWQEKFATSKDAWSNFKSVAKDLYDVEITDETTLKEGIDELGGLVDFAQVMSKKENHKLYPKLKENGLFDRVTTENYKEYLKAVE